MYKFLFYFLPFVLTANFVNAAQDANLENVSDRGLAVQQSLQQVNKDFFLPRSMRLDLLKNCPEAIPAIAQWLSDEWSPRYGADLTQKRYVQSLITRLNSDRLPMAFVVLKKGEPVGTVSLKSQADFTSVHFPEGLMWLFNLYVIPELRKQGLGQELLNFAKTIAGQFGCEKLFFETTPANVRWYLKRGALVIEEWLDEDNVIMYFPSVVQ